MMLSEKQSYRQLIPISLCVKSLEEQPKATTKRNALWQSDRSGLALSPISIWEVIVLLEKRRIEIDQDFGQWFERSRVDFELQEAPLGWKVAHKVRFVSLGYRHPADRFLAATARAYDFTLVTADERLLRLPDVKTLANIPPNREPEQNQFPQR